MIPYIGSAGSALEVASIFCFFDFCITVYSISFVENMDIHIPFGLHAKQRVYIFWFLFVFYVRKFSVFDVELKSINVTAVSRKAG